MRAPSPRHTDLASLVGLALVGALVGACGESLYDADGAPALQGGNGLTCDVASQVVCGGVCTTEDASHCGSSCADCTTQANLPAGAAAACVLASGGSTCGYRCADGLLRCASGCCAATQVAAGDQHTCALLSDGSVSCWGANGAGQLGDGTVLSRPTPRGSSITGAAIAIGAGARHACAVTQTGAVRCWGANDGGQITGSATASPFPSATAAPVTSGAVEVVAGASHTCARLATGAVRCWGANDGGQTGGGEPVASGAVAVTSGAHHSCALLSGGSVRCWGSNANGALGNGTTSGTTATPLPSGIAIVAAGASQTCAATGTSNGSGLDDALRCWGDSLGSTFLMASPQTTPAIPRKDASQSTIRFEVDRLAVGRKHVCVRKAGESVECLGANDRGQLGGTPVGASEAVTVPLPVTVPATRSLAAGLNHTCAVVGDGRLRCWGANESGQLGDGSTADPGAGAIVTPAGL